ncbi:hypothetical protein EAY64_04935 [Aquitalea palustris]|uniref:Secreted protein n=1 Tax=Aquitalea palustris TaxID=2480983 RepID=A0A454JLF6_9NEIS|nr:hypothetical protein [Aquitalea palustris]RMD00425.1 hypothetical protein EAY64_04935 [Aquitalea palustris]
MFTRLALLAASSLLLGEMALANGASAPAVDCPKAEQAARGKRILQNQAIGRALDKNPIAIGLTRRAKNKQLDADGC